METLSNQSIFQLGKAIQLDRERLQKLEAGILPGAPHVSDSEAFPAAVANLKKRIKTRTARYIEEYTQMCRWVDKIDDPYVQQLFTMLYIEGCSAETIARKMGMTATTVRSDIYRYRKAYGVQWKAKHPRMNYQLKETAAGGKA